MGVDMMRRLFAAAVCLASAPAMAQEPKPEVATVSYALKRICSFHLEATGGSGLFAVEVKSNGWSHRAPGGGVMYEKSKDWGRVRVMSAMQGYASRCTIAITPAGAGTVDAEAIRDAVTAFVAERYPQAKHEKDRAPAGADGKALESLWTQVQWNVRMGEMPEAAAGKPTLQVGWGRDF
jgi:hypothetical protein